MALCLPFEHHHIVIFEGEEGGGAAVFKGRGTKRGGGKREKRIPDVFASATSSRRSPS